MRNYRAFFKVGGIEMKYKGKERVAWGFYATASFLGICYVLAEAQWVAEIIK